MSGPSSSGGDHFNFSWGEKHSRHFFSNQHIDDLNTQISDESTSQPTILKEKIINAGSVMLHFYKATKDRRAQYEIRHAVLEDKKPEHQKTKLAFIRHLVSSGKATLDDVKECDDVSIKMQFAKEHPNEFKRFAGVENLFTDKDLENLSIEDHFFLMKVDLSYSPQDKQDLLQLRNTLKYLANPPMIERDRSTKVDSAEKQIKAANTDQLKQLDKKLLKDALKKMKNAEAIQKIINALKEINPKYYNSDIYKINEFANAHKPAGLPNFLGKDYTIFTPTFKLSSYMTDIEIEQLPMEATKKLIDSLLRFRGGSVHVKKILELRNEEKDELIKHLEMRYYDYDMELYIKYSQPLEWREKSVARSHHEEAKACLTDLPYSFKGFDGKTAYQILPNIEYNKMSDDAKGYLIGSLIQLEGAKINFKILFENPIMKPILKKYMDDKKYKPILDEGKLNPLINKKLIQANVNFINKMLKDRKNKGV